MNIEDNNENLIKHRSGVYSLLLTPFYEDLSIDYKAFENYVAFQASKKPQHLFAVCGSSEMTNLTLEERLNIATLAVKNSGDSEVFASANMEPSWLAQVDEVKRMEETGVDGLVFVTKGYGDNQERMFTYLSELASHTKLPIMLYEFPGFKPHKMTGQTYGKLVETGRFIAIKDTTCTMPKIKEKIAVQGNTAVLQANIPYLFDSYIAGARGVCATPTSCGTGLFVKMWDEFSNGKLEEAKKTFEHIILLDNAIGNGFNLTAKYLLNLQGVPFRTINRNNSSLSPASLHSIKVFYEWAKSNGIEL
ncbi:MAG TPA: dihydrodipicolinate synthase family protein [Clostridia bacterium]|nr:dihydrodipicolinate synthase family protein [Clostridia bacterium]